MDSEGTGYPLKFIYFHIIRIEWDKVGYIGSSISIRKIDIHRDEDRKQQEDHAYSCR
jgi:hypothetical protein